MRTFSNNLRNNMRQNNLRKMSSSNGMVNSMMIHSGVKEMDELIKQHPEIQQILDTMTSHYGYFDASLDSTDETAIIHTRLLNGEKLHIVMDFESKKVYVMDDMNYRRIRNK